MNRLSLSRLYDRIRHRFYNRIENSRFLANFVSIAKANIFSQLLLLAATPILTRLYSPADFGLAAIFLTSVQIIGSFCTWKFDRTIPNARTSYAARQLAAFGLATVITVATLSLLLVRQNPWGFLNFSSFEKLGALLYWLPLAIIATGLVQLGSAWYARKTKLTAVSYSVVAYSLLYLTSALAAGVIGLGTGGLIFSSVFALWCQVVVLICLNSTEPFVSKGTIRRTSVVLSRNIKTASVASVVTFVNTISFAAPVYLLSHKFQLSEVGLYVLMVRIIATPLGTITKSLSLSFWSRAAQLARAGNYKNIWHLYLKVSFTLSLLAIAIIIICFTISRYIAVILGEYWIDAGPVLIASIPYLVGLAIVSPTNHLIVLGKQSLQLYADGLRLALLVLIIYCGGKFDLSFTDTVFLFSCASLAGHICLMLTHMWIYKVLLATNK